MGAWIHRTVGWSTEKGLIKCSNCGWVEFVWANGGRTRRCINSRKESSTPRDKRQAELVDELGGRCWACDTAEKLVVDHCHKEGFIRGVLCSRCNLILGQVADDPKLLRRLADYLES